jgi:hypothetical protein
MGASHFCTKCMLEEANMSQAQVRSMDTLFHAWPSMTTHQRNDVVKIMHRLSSMSPTETAGLVLTLRLEKALSTKRKSRSTSPEPRAQPAVQQAVASKATAPTAEDKDKLIKDIILNVRKYGKSIGGQFQNPEIIGDKLHKFDQKTLREIRDKRIADYEQMKELRKSSEPKIDKKRLIKQILASAQKRSARTWDKDEIKRLEDELKIHKPKLLQEFVQYGVSNLDDLYEAHEQAPEEPEYSST